MDYIDTKDVAAELRNRLKSAFPGVKFSVRKGTGTASAWISVYWTDGPCTADVEEHTRPMQGAQFNGMEDRYESTDNTVTVTVKGRKVTGKPLVDGINTHRDVSDDALKAAAVLWSEAHDGTEPPTSGMLAACVVDGHVIQENWAPQQMWQIASDVVLPQRWAAAKEQAAAQAARPANAREQGDEARRDSRSSTRTRTGRRSPVRVWATAPPTFSSATASSGTARTSTGTPPAAVTSRPTPGSWTRSPPTCAPRT
ncbi:LPD29 domain-containing protein [Streptomyces olivochromogenes]|uniref:LPD29 domain-containing protein n=1 Tax=Streptomyces olivochromogenes TaxID=1963 RepID=UPI0036D9323E